MINPTKFASASALYLKRELKLNQDQTEIMAFALDICYSAILSFLAVFLISQLLFKVTSYAMTAMITVAVIRVFTGGAHCSSSARCLTAGIVTYPVFGLFIKFMVPLISDVNNGFLLLFVVVAGLFAAICIHLWAPAETPGKPISTKLARQVLINGAFIMTALVSSFAFLGVGFKKIDSGIAISAILGLIWQGFSLTPTGYRFINFLDNLLNRVGVK
jgi:accessory gene regulator B